MIPKKKGNYRVDRFRTILLYESGFNFNKKILGVRMMQQAEFDKLLAVEQYGSSKKKTDIKCTLNKRFLIYYAKFRRTLEYALVTTNHVMTGLFTHSHLW